MLDVESSCPSCKEESSYNINLVSLLANLGNVNYQDTINVNDLTIKFNPLSYRKLNDINLAQFEIEKAIRNLENMENDEERLKSSNNTMKSLNNLSMALITEAIESIATPSVIVTEKEHINDFLRNCDKHTYDILKTTAVKFRESSQLKPLKVKCIHCQHEYELPLTLNVTDFFD
jgi:hypothetical protein